MLTAIIVIAIATGAVAAELGIDPISETNAIMATRAAPFD
jgi:hypothetical protein